MDGNHSIAEDLRPGSPLKSHEKAADVIFMEV